MARWMGSLAVSGWLWLTVTGIASGQVLVESGLGAARAATTTAPAAGLGKSISGLTGSLDKALKAGQPDSGTRSGLSAPAATAKAPAAADGAAPAAVKFEDPNLIEVGLHYADLVRRFGPPSLEITGETGKTLTYTSKAGAFHLDVENGQVTSIRKPKS